MVKFWWPSRRWSWTAIPRPETPPPIIITSFSLAMLKDGAQRSDFIVHLTGRRHELKLLGATIHNYILSLKSLASSKTYTKSSRVTSDAGLPLHHPFLKVPSRTRSTNNSARIDGQRALRISFFGHATRVRAFPPTLDPHDAAQRSSRAINGRAGGSLLCSRDGQASSWLSTDKVMIVG